MLTPAQEKRIKKIQEENLKLLEMFNDFPYVSNPLWKTTIEEGSYMHRVNSGFRLYTCISVSLTDSHHDTANPV